MNIITNKKQLATTPLRKDALAIIESGYRAIDIKYMVDSRVRVKGRTLTVRGTHNRTSARLPKDGRVYVIGVGKGTNAAVHAIAGKLKSRMTEGLSLDIKGSPRPLKNYSRVIEMWGTHPTPSLKNIRATKRILSTVKHLSGDDLVVYVIGGGGSSLLCGSFQEYILGKDVFSKMTLKGAPIQDLNIVRKHLSEVKGGWLAYHTYPARSLSLIVSDVCGDDDSVIASGPTVYDKSTVNDARSVLKKYGVSTTKLLLNETPKDKKLFVRARHLLFVDNSDALMAMKKKAVMLGYKAHIFSTALEGEAKTALVSMVKKTIKGEALLAGGETTVRLGAEKGIGGRNQEASLGVLADAWDGKLSLLGTLAISFASDGYDNTPSAGAFADATALVTASEENIDPTQYLLKHDSFTFFSKMGNMMHVKHTAFNVSDLMLVLKK